MEVRLVEEYGEAQVGEVTDGEAVCICYCYPGQSL